MAQKKGNFIIRNAAGSVVLAGLAALVNNTGSADFNDATQINDEKDALGVTRTLTKDQEEHTLDLDLTPGIGADLGSKAAVLAAIAGLRKGMSITTSGFDDGDFNWSSNSYGILMSVGKAAKSGASLTVKVQARRILDLATSTYIDFTGAWATI